MRRGFALAVLLGRPPEGFDVKATELDGIVSPDRRARPALGAAAPPPGRCGGRSPARRRPRQCRRRARGLLPADQSDGLGRLCQRGPVRALQSGEPRLQHRRLAAADHLRRRPADRPEPAGARPADGTGRQLSQHRAERLPRCGNRAGSGRQPRRAGEIHDRTGQGRRRGLPHFRDPVSRRRRRSAERAASRSRPCSRPRTSWCRSSWRASRPISGSTRRWAAAGSKNPEDATQPIPASATAPADAMPADAKASDDMPADDMPAGDAPQKD